MTPDQIQLALDIVVLYAPLFLMITAFFAADLIIRLTDGGGHYATIIRVSAFILSICAYVWIFDAVESFDMQHWLPAAMSTDGGPAGGVRT